MKNYIGLEKLSYNSDYELLTWNELRIGDLYMHIRLHNFMIKTGTQSYFNISKHTFHHRPKLLQQCNNQYKNFIRCSYVLSVNDIKEDG